MKSTDVYTPFLVLRYPTLPLSVYRRISADDSNPDDIDSLIALIGEWPQLEEALYLASPEIYAAWQQARSRTPFVGRARRKLFLTLQKYLIRATTRATPYGLFAGCATLPPVTISHQGPKTQAIVEPTATSRVYRRFDVGYLARVAYELCMLPSLWPFLVFRPNSSLYRLGSAWRYTEYEYHEGQRNHRLVHLDDSPLLSRVLQVSQPGITYRQLFDLQNNISADSQEYAGFIDELIGSQVLTADLLPNITGEAFQTVFFRKIESIAGQISDPDLRQRLMHLSEAGRVLTIINAGSTGALTGYQDLHRYVAEAGFPYTPGQLIHTDLIHQPVQLSFSTPLLDQLHEAIGLLSSFSTDERMRALIDFEARFLERYESQSVPLAVALDPEIGIPFGSPTPETSRNQGTSPNRTALLMSLYRRALRDRLTVLTLDTVDNLPVSSSITDNGLGKSFGALVKLIQLDSEPGLLFRGVSGSSATNMLSRFSHADATLATELDQLVRQEQALFKEYVLADLSHLPQDRAGNVVMRQTVRAYEIPYGVHSVHEPAGVIRVSDLVLRHRHGRLQLWSSRLQKPIIPLLSSAFNFALDDNMPLFRFLGYYQFAATQSKEIQWNWGFLSGEPFLPRMQYKQVVLSPATWNLPVAELHQSAKEGRLLTTLQTVYGLPRYVAITEGDNQLTLDLTRSFSLDLLLEQARNRTVVTVQEALFDEQNDWVIDSEGNRYAAEMVVPFLARPDSPAMPSVSQSVHPFVQPSTVSKHFPGSAWAYVKLYVGASVSDDLLRHLAPLFNDWVSKGRAKGWFFVRYADPDHHLRIRLRMTSPRSVGSLVRTLHQTVIPYVEAGLLTRICFDTYVPEDERYGAARIDQSEVLFFANSQFVMSVLAIAEQADPGVGELIRQVGAIRLIDTWLTLADLPVDQRSRLSETAANQLLGELEEAEQEVMKGFLSNYYRQHKVLLQQILDPAVPSDFAYATALADQCGIFLERIRPIQLALNKQTQSPADEQQFLTSHIHMFVNRLFSQHQRIEELRIYDLYRRSLLALAGRRKQAL